MKHATNGLVILGVTFAVVLIILFKKYQRDPRARAILYSVSKDRKALVAGVAWMLFVLVTRFASDGFHGGLIGVPAALIGGCAAAALVNWFTRRRDATNL